MPCSAVMQNVYAVSRASRISQASESNKLEIRKFGEREKVTMRSAHLANSMALWEAGSSTLSRATNLGMEQWGVWGSSLLRPHNGLQGTCLE